MKPLPSSAPKQVVGGDLHLVEEQFGGVLRVLAQLLKVAAALEALDLVGLHEQQRDAFGALSRIGLGDDADQVRRLAVGDERLRAVDDIAIAGALGRRLDALQVGSRSRLGHGDGADQFARRHARQPALLLLLGAVMDDVRHDDRVVQAGAEAIDALQAQLFHQHDLVAIVAADAAVFGRGREAEQSRIARLLPQRGIDAVVFAPAVDVRRLGVLVEEFRDRILEHADFFVLHEIRTLDVQHAHEISRSVFDWPCSQAFRARHPAYARAQVHAKFNLTPRPPWGAPGQTCTHA